LTARLPAEQAAIVLAALDTCQEQLELAAAKEQSSAEASPAGGPAARPEEGTESSAEAAEAADAAAAARSAAGGSPAWPAGWLPDWLADTPQPSTSQSQSQSPESSAEASITVPAESSAEASPAQPCAAPRPRVSRQQALLQLAQDWLDHQSESVRRRSKPRLIAHLDPLSGWARLHNGELLPPAIAQTLSLTLFDMGRAQREVDLRLRQFLSAVDGERCRFPGCRNTRHLQAHHVLWWSRGGATDLANLILVCGRHHRLIHDEQYTLTLDPDRTLSVRAADGTPLPARPDLPAASAEDLDPGDQITADTCPNPWAADRLHLAYAVSVLMHLAA
jgi:hypothetical protein